MDRRTVLAFVLIFIIYIGTLKLYEALYKPAKPPARPGAAETTAAQRGAAGPAGAGGTATTPAPAEPTGAPGIAAAGGPAATGPQAPDVLRFAAPAAAAAKVRVSTDLYDLEIDPLGARITSWEGRRFKGPNGGPVQLVPAVPLAPPPTSGDAILFERGELDLTAAPYVPGTPGPLVVKPGEAPGTLTFSTTTAGGLVVRKTYRFHPGRYDMDVTLEVGARDAGAAEAERSAVGTARAARLAWGQGIASTEQNKKPERPAFKSFEMVGEELVFRSAQALSGGIAKVAAEARGTVRFAGVQNRYFTIAGMVPGAQAHPAEGVARISGNPAAGAQTWSIEVPLEQTGGGQGPAGSAALALYVGPIEFELLKSYGAGLEKTVDLGWPLFRPLTVGVLRLMNWMYRWLPNYGLIIILLSVITKIGFYPLTRSQTQSMKRMQEVQPKMKALQDKYKNNQQKLGEEMMKLYREEKINPLGGCLPMLVQAPVFIALYQVLRNTIALRQAPFVFWIHDLGQPDALFRLPLGPISEFNLLPILMAATTYWQMKLTPNPQGANPSLAMMNKMMPVIMLFFFYGFPSGLVLYWLVNNLLTIYQTWKIHQTAPAAGGARS